MVNPNTERYLDYDAIIAESDNKPIRIKVYGKIEELPSSLPVAVILNLTHAQKTGKLDTLAGADAIELGVSVFGEERVNRWAKENNQGIEQLADLLKRVVRMYSEYTPHAGAANAGGGSGSNGPKSG